MLQTADATTAELPAFIAQRYTSYDEEAHAVWRVLFERRMATLIRKKRNHQKNRTRKSGPLIV